MLFDTLHTSFLKINSQENYIQLESNIDLVGNNILFVHPKTKLMSAISAGKINELIVQNCNNDMIFRTMEGSNFKKSSNDFVFYQVLNDDPYQLIKVPFVELIEADYKQAYSPGRQYDEFKKTFRYYIISNDGKVHQCQLTERSIMKIFPEKKDMIEKITKGKSYPDKEAIVIDILKNF
jgi:hypothetical protein